MINMLVQPSDHNIQTMIMARKVLNLPDSKRRTLMRSWGRKVRAEAQSNAKNQVNVDGSKWAPRKKRKNKKEFDKKGNRKNQGKMMKNITKGRNLNVKTLGVDAVLVDWKRPGIGKLARQHQEGMADLFNIVGSHKFVDEFGKYSKPATQLQAKSLISEGYKIRNARKLNWNKEKQYSQYRKRGASNWVRPTQSWIISNLTLGQAGLILREMRTVSPKKSWKISRPSRSFLGASKEQITDMLDEVYEAMLERKRNK